MKSKIKKIVDNSNKVAQVMQATEELSELIQALMKNVNRGQQNEKDVLSEMADVQIMIEQLKIIFNFKDQDVENEMKFKIERYFKRKGWN